MSGHRLDHGLAAGRAVEVELPIQGEDLERIEVWAMTGRRIGRQVSGLQEGIAAEVFVQVLVVRAFEQAFIDRGECRRQASTRTLMGCRKKRFLLR
jgi:hypothetical protein